MKTTSGCLQDVLPIAIPMAQGTATELNAFIQFCLSQFICINPHKDLILCITIWNKAYAPGKTLTQI
jgi:hypothetical protein